MIYDAQIKRAVRALPWIVLVLILIVALWIRLPMLDGLGFQGDQSLFQQWAQASIYHGLPAIYAADVIVDHPPIDFTLQSLSARLFARDIDTPIEHNPGLAVALKWPSLVFDLLLIAVSFLIARQSSNLTWAALIASALALTPGLLADSIWWGQTDSIFTFFLVMTCYELGQRRVVSGWLFYALTLMTKFQGIVLAPLVVVATLGSSRMATRRALATFAVVIALIVGPFVLGSGILALRPYLASSLKYQYVTLNAHNLWYWLVSYGYDPSQGWDHLPRDNELYVGPLSARTLGLLLVSAAAIMIMLRMIRQGTTRVLRGDEFLLAAGLYAAFFVFSTQMHERYLYPGVVLLWLAAARDHRLLPLAIGFSLTFSHNVLAVVSRQYPLWQAIWPWLAWPDVVNAAIQTLLAVLLLGIIAMPLLKAILVRRKRVSASLA